MKTPIYTGLFQSDLDANGYRISGLLTPSASTDAATKDYVDSHGGGGGGFQYDVTQYGATGDGVTDDTTAIQDALAAIPSTGGLLYFPAGHYKYTGTTLTLNKPVTVQGDGGGCGGLSDSPQILTPAISRIDFNSPTVPLFTVTSHSCAFKDIELSNSSGTTPSAGAGILVSANGDQVNFQNLTVNSFYINIDVQAGQFNQWQNCLIVSPVLYGIKTRDILIPDGGDHAISNCWFVAGRARNATAGLRIESAGGMKVANCKFVCMDTARFVNGIDLAVANSVTTVDLLVANCSIENFTGSGIKGTTGTSSTWPNILITGNQIGPIPGSAYGINFTGTAAGDFNGLVITGNWGTGGGSPNPFIQLTNCSNVIVNGNGQRDFGSLLSVGAGVTFADSPVYIGMDARLVSISGGVKLEVRNTGTGTWVEATRYTNP